MADQPLVADSRRRRASRAAVLVTLLALALLAWEAVDRPARPQPGRGQRYTTARARHRASPPVTARRQTAKIVPPVPTPPPPPPPPPVVAPVDPATLRLSDILQDPDPAVRFAVIDGVAVRAGEMIGGHPVRAVLPDRVLIGEESETVLIPEEEDR